MFKALKTLVSRPQAAITVQPVLAVDPRSPQELRNDFLVALARKYRSRVEKVFEDNRVWGSDPVWTVAPRYMAMGIRLLDYSQVQKALGLTQAIGLAVGYGDGTREPPITTALVEDKIVYQFLLPEFIRQGGIRLRLWVDIPVDYPGLRGGVGVGMYNTVIPFEFREDAPHSRVTGTSGSGKTELMKTILYQLATHYRISDLGIAIIDPKRDFEPFTDEEHLLWNPAYTDTDAEMVIRHFYAEFVRREEANERNARRWLLCIDEADQGFLAQSTENHDWLNHIARRGRYVKMHLLIGTHKADKSSLGGLPANLAYRWHGRVPTAAESGQVEGGLALHKLSGRGDFYHVNGPNISRFQAALTLPNNFATLTRTRIPPAPHDLPPMKPSVEVPERKANHRPRIEINMEQLAYYFYHGPDNVTQAEAAQVLGLKRRTHEKHKAEASRLYKAFKALESASGRWDGKLLGTGVG